MLANIWLIHLVSWTRPFSLGWRLSIGDYEGTYNPIDKHHLKEKGLVYEIIIHLEPYINIHVALHASVKDIVDGLTCGCSLKCYKTPESEYMHVLYIQ